MARMKNNDIYISRGETAALNFRIWNDDGTPFILPPVHQDLDLRLLTESSKGHYTFHCPIFVKSIVVLLNSTDTNKQIFVFVKKGEQVTTIATHHGGKAIIDGVITQISVENETIKQIQCELDDNKQVTIQTTGIATVLALTIRAGMYDRIMTQKLINGSAAITQGGKTDYTFGGLNKFTTNEILEKPSISELKLALEEQYPSVIQVGKVGDNYYHLMHLKDGTFELMPYEFNISIPLEYTDTDFEAGGYTYDLIAYNGKASQELFDNDQLLFNSTYWKKELVKPHKFIIGDSHNA